VCTDIGYSYNDVQATEQASKTKTSKPETKNVQPTEEDDSEDPAPVVPAKPAARRGRKAVKKSGTTTNEDIHSLAEDDSEVEPPTKAPARRGRKPAIESGTSASEEQQHAPPAKPGRKTRTTKLTAEQLDPEVPVNHTRKGRAKGKGQDMDEEGTGTRGTRRKPIDVEVDEDPLDSLGGTEGEEAGVVPVAKGRRNAKNRPTKVEVIKEEMADPALETDEPQAETEAAATRSGRGKKTAPPSTGAPPKSRTRAATSAKKAGAVPAGSVTSEDGVDKENTPGSGSLDDEEVVEKSVKIRVSRTRKGANAATKVKEESLTEPEVPTRTRAARTRTRT